MKIRSQLSWLLGLPIVCQLISVAFLANSLAQEEELATKEMKAKRIVAISLEVNGILAQAILGLLGGSLVGHADKSTLSERVQLQVQNKAKELRELLGGNRTDQKLLNKFIADSERLITNMDDLARSYQPGNDKLFVSQFLNKDEFLESLALLLRNMRSDSDALMLQYSPQAREFQPKTVRAKIQLRNTVIAAIIVNLSVIVILALVLNRKTLTRLNILMTNIRSFASRNDTITPLEGDDELSELNKAFYEVAMARKNLEQARESMRAMVSHDLRSPLTSMGLRVGQALTDKSFEFNPRTRQTLIMLQSEITRLQRLANTLLDIDKIEDESVELECELIYCEDLVDAAFRSVESLAERSAVELKKCVEDEQCYCDKDRSIQVLVNLISNAIKFSPRGSQIQVRVSSSGNFTRFEIMDEGPGVLASEANELFGKFRQLSQDLETKKLGSGLGLYICKVLITAQKGRIGYTPGDRKGSCFWIELPVDDEATS